MRQSRTNYYSDTLLPNAMADKRNTQSSRRKDFFTTRKDDCDSEYDSDNFWDGEDEPQRDSPPASLKKRHLTPSLESDLSPEDIETFKSRWNGNGVNIMKVARFCRIFIFLIS